jgi:PAS domain-containing protein
MMKNNNVLSPLKSLFQLGPLFYILAVIWIDYKVTASIITPVFGVIGLTYMALSFSPRRMLFWAITYSLIVTGIFFIPQIDYLLNSHQITDPITAWTRTGSFFVTSVLACRYCNSLHELRTMNKEQEGVLNLMGEPIVTSDIDGKIRFMNNSAKTLLFKSGESGQKNYFESFFPKKTMGASIANYLKQFDDQKVQGFLDVEVASKQYHANTQMLTSGRERILVTIVSSKAAGKSDA